MPVTPTIEVDDTLKERSSHGSFELPIETYTDNCEIFHSLYNHWHDEMELIYIESGSGLIRLNKEILRVKAGDLIIVNRGVLHGIKTDLKNILYFRSIVFDLNFLSGPAGDLCQERVISLLMDNQAEFTHIISRSDDNYGNICLLFDRIHSCHKEKKPYYFVKLKALFFSFFYEMLMGNYITPADAPLSRNKNNSSAIDAQSAAERIPNHPAQKERRCCRSFLLSHGRDCAILIPDETRRTRYQVHENSRKRFYPRRQVPCR